MKKFLPTTFASLMLLLSAWSFSATAQTSHHNDKPAVHGMVIFGREKLYAYHLPMFHPPHNYQVIFQIQLDKETMLGLVRDHQLNPEHATYTLEPEKFILPDMIANPQAFKANIYRGHFERGGVKVFSDVTVQIADVLYSNELNAMAERGETFKLLVFGNQKEQYAAHLLTNKPDFDQIIQVNLDPSLLKDAKFIKVDFPSLENRITGVSGNALNAFLIDHPVKMIFLKQVYLETNDLQE